MRLTSRDNSEILAKKKFESRTIIMKDSKYVMSSPQPKQNLDLISLFPDFLDGIESIDYFDNKYIYFDLSTWKKSSTDR